MTAVTSDVTSVGQLATFRAFQSPSLSVTAKSGSTRLTVAVNPFPTSREDPVLANLLTQQGGLPKGDVAEPATKGESSIRL